MHNDGTCMSKITTPAVPALIERAAAWLGEQALNDADLEAVVRGCCARLHGAGLPIARVKLVFSVLHPLHRALGLTWQPGQGLQVQAYRHVSGSTQPDFFRQSPYYHLLKHDFDHLRRRLDTGEPADFPLLDTLRGEGLTDYLAFANSFAKARGEGMLGSWATRQRGGFADGEIDALLAIQYPLAVACKMAMLGGVARSTLATYLGANAGRRVLAGQIRRGDGETTRAAIVWGDLRNSTRMADQLGRKAYIDNLNDFFDATAGAVADAGGDILGFIGDGFLAIFPCDSNQTDSGAACKRALSSALKAVDGMIETNRRRQAKGKAALGYGLSLHVGSVLFGNVGLPERLSFSVFGSAVNEAARLETLTKKFATPIIASRAFMADCGGAWQALGNESLRGVDSPIAVFRPVQPQPPPPQITAHRQASDDRNSSADAQPLRARPCEKKIRSGAG